MFVINKQRKTMKINLDLTPLELNAIQVAMDNLVQDYTDGDNQWWRDKDLAEKIRAMKNVIAKLKQIKQ